MSHNYAKQFAILGGLLGLCVSFTLTSLELDRVVPGMLLVLIGAGIGAWIGRGTDNRNTTASESERFSPEHVAAIRRGVLVFAVTITIVYMAIATFHMGLGPPPGANKWNPLIAAAAACADFLWRKLSGARAKMWGLIMRVPKWIFIVAWIAVEFAINYPILRPDAYLAFRGTESLMLGWPLAGSAIGAAFMAPLKLWYVGAIVGFAFHYWVIAAGIAQHSIH